MPRKRYMPAKRAIRLIWFGLLFCGCPSVPPIVQRCAEICGDTGVQRVTNKECVCQPKVEAPATVPLDPIGC